MNNEEKILDMLVRMQSEITGLRGEMNEGFKELKLEIVAVDAKVDAVDAKVDAVDAKVNKTNMILEQMITPKIDVLFDGNAQYTDQMERLDSKVDIIQKDVDYLIIKTVAQSDKIIDISKRVK